MVDQSFSSKNFQTIIDLENRRGKYVEGNFQLNEILSLNKEIKTIRKLIRIAKTKEDFDVLPTLVSQKKELEEIKKKTMHKILELISQTITKKGFKIDIQKINLSDNKVAYTTKSNLENYLALKQIQRNVSLLYKTKQSNRSSILNQLKIILEDRFPKIIVRTDIKDFYESIPHEPILQKLSEDSLLSPLTRKLIRTVLSNYRQLSSSTCGVPRGIGISAYLSEIFMRKIDQEITRHTSVTYYARYVDDIVIIFTPAPDMLTHDFLSDITKIIETQNGLTINQSKTKVINLINPPTQEEIFSYLGYEISINIKGGLEYISMSPSKVNKYKSRIDKSFKEYENLSKVSEKKARRILVKRIRYLTGNTRLRSNKSGIFVGIYYSNSHLNNMKDITRLDDCLKNRINHLSSTTLKQRLRKYTFKEGFERKRFSPFTPSELSEIVRAWKH